MSESTEKQNDELAALYHATVVEHATHPRGYGLDIGATHFAEGLNPLCGDHIHVQLRVAEGTIEAAAFNGESCAICCAAASLLCENLPGEPIASVDMLAETTAASFQAAGNDDLADWLNPLLGVRSHPTRLRCALLPFETARAAIESGPD